jgi:hypothetical protein
MMRAASVGDRPGLARAVALANDRGTLTLGDAADVGHAVLERELRTSQAPDDAARVRDVRGCAEDVDDALAERMKGSDVAAGEAALARVESGALDRSTARAYIAAADEHWRAVGMSGMTRDRDRDARLRGLVDGSMLVRSAALHAVIGHDDPADFDAVLEVARVDPEPFQKSTAVRALGRMAGQPANVVDRLRDLWTGADEGLREDIAGVLASRTIYAMGGREALAHMLATSRDNEAVAVAGAILGSNVDDATLRAGASAVLVQALLGDGERSRIHAIAVVPVGREGMPEEESLLDALRAASRAEDADVQVAALGRLATARGTPPGDRSAAVSKLEEVAAPTTAFPPRSSRARFLLAAAGDLRVQAWIEADLRSPDASVRLGALDALAMLGRASRAAPLMADEDPRVRSRAACTIVAAARSARPAQEGRGRRM